MSDFARIKEEVDLLALILREAGGKVLRDYGHYVHLEECPFCGGHECFSVHKEGRGNGPFYHCFQCGAGGDAITFIQKFRNLSSPVEALRVLSPERGLPLSGTGRTPASPSQESPRQRIFERAARYYQEVLFSSKDPAPLTHLIQVRKHSTEILKEFGVGFTDGGLHRHLADLSREELISSGLVTLRGEELQDAFPPGLFVYPHKLPSGLIGDFTCKPFGKDRLPLRLRADYREKGCLFWNQGALSENEIILVEGQNDLLSVAGKAGRKNVLATCGQLSGDQLALLKEASRGRKVFLAFDQDEAGRRYSRKVRETLSPLPGKLMEILGEQGSDVRALSWPEGHKDIDEYLRAQKDPQKAFGVLLDQALPLFEPLTKCFSIYREYCSERKMNFYSPDSAKAQAVILWEWLGGEKAFFIEKNGSRCYLSHGGKVLNLGAEPAFRALLYDVADLVYSEPRAKIIFDALECQCLLHGRRVQVSPWLYTQESTIYLHTGGVGDLVLKIEPDSVTSVPNARHCLLRPSNKMFPIEFDPDVNVEAAFRDVRDLLLLNLSTDPANRYYALSWLFSIFFMGFTHDRGLLHMMGTAASGKTTAANLCSVLLYGEDWVGKSKTASDFADGMTNPLTIKDNLENRDIDQGTFNFLIAAVTGTVNQKRKGGTDSENVYERLYNQVIVTSIEPLDLGRGTELPTRIWNMEFDSKFHNPGFQKTLVLEKLKEKRSQILSAFFLVMAREILPSFERRRQFYLGYLRQMFPSHPKARLGEFHSVQFLVLEALLKYLPDERRPRLPTEKMARELVEELMTSQAASAKEAASQTNVVLFFLDQLVSELTHAKSTEDFSREFQIRHEVERFSGGTPSRVSFRDTSLKFHAAFSVLAKKKNLLSPFTTPQQMGARLKDSQKILEDGGWKVDRYTSQGRTMFYCMRDIGEDGF